MHGMLKLNICDKLSIYLSLITYFSFDCCFYYLVFCDIKLCCVTSAQENQMKMTDTEIIIKITKSEIKTELELQTQS